MKDSVISVYDDAANVFRTGLVVADGHKYWGVIWPQAKGMKINKVEKQTARFTIVEGYPLKKAKAKLRKCGKKFGITKSAKKALRGIKLL